MSGCTLVTGGAGFIGSYVVSALLAEGRQVSRSLQGEDTRNLRGLSVDTIEGDIRESEVVRAALRGVDRVFHLAAVYALWTKTPGLMQSVNVEGTATCFRSVKTWAYSAWSTPVRWRCLRATETVQPPKKARLRLGSRAVNMHSPKGRIDVARSFVARGLDVVIAAPCGPIGPGDVGPTQQGGFCFRRSPTGSSLLSILYRTWGRS